MDYIFQTSLPLFSGLYRDKKIFLYAFCLLYWTNKQKSTIKPPLHPKDKTVGFLQCVCTPLNWETVSFVWKRHDRFSGRTQAILKGHGIPAHIILKFIYVQILDFSCLEHPQIPATLGPPTAYTASPVYTFLFSTLRSTLLTRVSLFGFCLMEPLAWRWISAFKNVDCWRGWWGFLDNCASANYLLAQLAT